MIRKIDTKACVKVDFKTSFEKEIKQGDIKLSFLIQNFKYTDILLSRKELFNRKYINIAAKSLFCNLQVGVYFTCNGKIAIFKRSEYDKNQKENLTSKFTMFKAWSPKCLTYDSMLESISKKVQIIAQGQSKLVFNEKGIAYTSVHDATKSLNPYYIFIIYEIEMDNESKINTPMVEDHKIDKFEGWFNPIDYNDFKHTFTNTIYFDGAIDRCVLLAIKNNSSGESSDFSRGVTFYFPHRRVIFDTNHQCFEESKIVLDQDEENYRHLDNITKKSRYESKTNEIVMFEPNWFGIGFYGKNLIKRVMNLFGNKKDYS